METTCIIYNYIDLTVYTVIGVLTPSNAHAFHFIFRHPDRNDDPKAQEEMIKVNEAYDVSNADGFTFLIVLLLSHNILYTCDINYLFIKLKG